MVSNTKMKANHNDKYDLYEDYLIGFYGFKY